MLTLPPLPRSHSFLALLLDRIDGGDDALDFGAREHAIKLDETVLVELAILLRRQVTQAVRLRRVPGEIMIERMRSDFPDGRGHGPPFLFCLRA